MGNGSCATILANGKFWRIDSTDRLVAAEPIHDSLAWQIEKIRVHSCKFVVWTFSAIGFELLWQ